MTTNKRRYNINKEDFIDYISSMSKEDMYEFIKQNGKRKLIRPYSRIIEKDNK